MTLKASIHTGFRGLSGTTTYMVFNTYNHSAAQLLIAQTMVNASHVI